MMKNQDQNQVKNQLKNQDQNQVKNHSQNQKQNQVKNQSQNQKQNQPKNQSKNQNKNQSKNQQHYQQRYSISKKVFICWAGTVSKKIAYELKKRLLEDIFPNSNLSFFISDIDISSGEDWYNKIKSELQNCNCGIVCMTKENILAPWLYFESGALSVKIKESLLIPFLFYVKLPSNCPLDGKQNISFTSEMYAKMCKDLNEKLKLTDITYGQIENLAHTSYQKMKKNLSDEIDKMDRRSYFSLNNIYPAGCDFYIKKKIYVSTPMASLSDSDYDKIQDLLPEINGALEKIKFEEIIFPALEKKNKMEFDGEKKSISENFPAIKSAECMLMIYPKPLPSSILVELGYGIALTKRIVIFVKKMDELPYVMRDTNAIENVNIYTYNDNSEIVKRILSNGMSLFE